MALSWDRVGPREEERALAGRVAGVLWLSVLPMVGLMLLLPGSVNAEWRLILALLVPPVGWGIACLVIPWERVGTPLAFHVPAILTFPYVALLISLTDITRSPLTLTTLMLLAFCAYFFPPRIAVPYAIGCVIVHALPLMYDGDAIDAGLLPHLWVSLFVYASVGGVIIVGKQKLVTLHDAANELSRRDSLTGLANRRALTELFGRHGGGVRRTDSLGLVLIDLDDFKEANTLYGFPGGDRVLGAVASALSTTAREDDLVVRLGGDEFAIVVRDVSQGGMKRLCERLLEAVRDSIAALGMPGLRLTASVGWSLYPDDADSVHELLTTADLALRAAKLNGKNCAQSSLDWDFRARVVEPSDRGLPADFGSS